MLGGKDRRHGATTAYTVRAPSEMVEKSRELGTLMSIVRLVKDTLRLFCSALSRKPRGMVCELRRETLRLFLRLSTACWFWPIDGGLWSITHTFTSIRTLDCNHVEKRIDKVARSTQTNGLKVSFHACCSENRSEALVALISVVVILQLNECLSSCEELP